jgi:ribose-phosphate pyrophosphokinase
MDFAVASKERHGDREVKVTLPEANYFLRNIVLVDDVASSGQTLIKAARQLKQHRPASLSVLVTHALFKDGSIQKLQEEGVTNIWSCNSVNHATNAVSLTNLLANGLKPYLS